MGWDGMGEGRGRGIEGGASSPDWVARQAPLGRPRGPGCRSGASMVGSVVGSMVGSMVRPVGRQVRSYPASRPGIHGLQVPVWWVVAGTRPGTCRSGSGTPCRGSALSEPRRATSDVTAVTCRRGFFSSPGLSRKGRCGCGARLRGLGCEGGCEGGCGGSAARARLRGRLRGGCAARLEIPMHLSPTPIDSFCAVADAKSRRCRRGGREGPWAAFCGARAGASESRRPRPPAATVLGAFPEVARPPRYIS